MSGQMSQEAIAALQTADMSGQNSQEAVTALHSADMSGHAQHEGHAGALLTLPVDRWIGQTQRESAFR